MLVSMMVPGRVFAEPPNLKVDFKGMDLTQNGDWGNPVTGNPGDKMRFRAILSNTGLGAAQDVYVQMPLFISGAKEQFPSFHILAFNSDPPDAALVVSLSSGAVINYIPGSAVMVRGGVSQAMSPDTAEQNITNRMYKMGDIPAGSSITFSYDVNLGSNPTDTTAVGGGTVAATAAATAAAKAVAGSAPNTGLDDSVWLSTGGWLALAAAGIMIRKWAGKIIV